MLRNDRLAQLIEQNNLSNPKLGKMVGLSASMIGKLVRGETHHTSHIYSIAHALRTNPDYLMGTSDNPAASGIDEVETVQVPQIDLRFSMGGGADTDLPVQAETMSFSRSWIRQFTAASTNELFFARGAGDSMYPTIGDGDVLLIDRSQNTPTMGDQIWAITQYGLGMIKRLRPTAEGYKILSDNPNVPPDTAADGSMHIIGRVIAVVRRV